AIDLFGGSEEKRFFCVPLEKKPCFRGPKMVKLTSLLCINDVHIIYGLTHILGQNKFVRWTCYQHRNRTTSSTISSRSSSQLG
ncbi:hypothetical protein ACJX0J_014479, partial [Zea mays]